MERAALIMTHDSPGELTANAIMFDNRYEATERAIVNMNTDSPTEPTVIDSVSHTDADAHGKN